ncbi:sensor histidine kinase [Roseateles cavernae]|uniref:sensor histidine kinase n=1 Tax=Roseateles cavernae TaxID=3153578 RepID=UPI0032E4C356
MRGLGRRLKRAHDWKRRAAHSLGARLVMVFVLLALASAFVVFGGVRAMLGQGWEGWLQPLTADYVDRLAAELGSPPSIARARALTQRLPISIAIRGPQLNWSSNQELGAAEPGFDPWRSRPAAISKLFTRHSADGHEIRMGLAPSALLKHPDRKGWWMLGALLLMVALAYAVVRRLLRPLQAIGAGAEAFGRGEFEHRIAVRREDELGDLARRFNTMAGQIQQMLDGKRALFLAISHELRSPLTRARLNAELIEEGPARGALLQDLALMRDLITDLLEAERLGSGHQALQREPCELNGLVRELVASRFAGAALRLELDEALPTLPLDRLRMQLLLRNLLDNALRYSEAGDEGQVLLRTRRFGGGVELLVRDQGPGVTEAELAQLGQPFYRPDAARTRASGGVGLGLSLCKLIAQAHGAPLTLRNARPGLEASLVLPLT